MSEKLKGVVKWFNDAKGFGFIENAKGDVFVHYSVIESAGFKTLKDGEEVEYEMDAGDKGLHAKKVVRVNAPAEAEAAPAKSSPKKAGSLASQIEVINTPDGEAPAPAPFTDEEESPSKDLLSH